MGKSLTRGPKQQKDNQTQSLKPPAEYPRGEWKQHTKFFHSNEFNLVFLKGHNHPLELLNLVQATTIVHREDRARRHIFTLIRVQKHTFAIYVVAPYTTTKIYARDLLRNVI